METTPAPGPARLTDFEIAEVAMSAGFTWPTTLVTAIAVALAESSGYPRLTNTAGNYPPSRDRGLWQINDYYHPEVSDAAAYNPIRCAAAAFAISQQGQDWSQWSSYVAGSHLKFRGRAQLAARAVVPGTFTLRRFLRAKDPYMFGFDIAALQHRIGIMMAWTKTLPVDGIYGPVTLAHVQRFQTVQHITADGIVGLRTARSLGWLFDPPNG